MLTAINSTAFRAVLVFFAFILLIGLAHYLHGEEPELKKSEIVKILNGGLVIIGIMYSILTYESNQVKIRHDIRVSKCSTTFKAMQEWNSASMIDYVKFCKDFQNRKEYKLLKNDTAAFIVEFEKSVNQEYRKSLLCILNYFESMAVGVNEDLMDEEFVKKYFENAFFEFYDTYYPFIKGLRKTKKNFTILSGFTNLVNKWRN
jgi:hypothetical protein